MYQNSNKDLYATVRGVSITGSTVTTAPMDESFDLRQVPAVHLELESLFKALTQMDEVIKEFSKRLIPVSTQEPSKDEPARVQPSNYCSIARQIADARVSVDDKTSALLQMMGALQI